MCGIVGAVAQRNVSPILLEGLRRLEYRGYDSAGIAVLNDKEEIQRVRVLGKVNALVESLKTTPLTGTTGISHTRWATHGVPSIKNAHPHQSKDKIALVHNGIIENHESLRKEQEQLGYTFETDTDTEVAVNQIHLYLQEGKDMLEAVISAVKKLDGAYALGVIGKTEPVRLIAVRSGSPLIIGIGIGEYFIASDIFALLPVTQQFTILEEGDVADIRRNSLRIFNKNGEEVSRPIITSKLSSDAVDKAGYCHYMLKEIFTQPLAISETMEGRIAEGIIVEKSFGDEVKDILDRTKAVQIVACGTSFHAGLVAKYWIESIVEIPCKVDIASEYRYQKTVVQEGTLFVTISQSGETADTLAALQMTKFLSYIGTLAICNVAESSLTRNSDLVFLTHAGPEIGVASTKAFTTQLVVLFMLTLLLARRYGGLISISEKELVQQLKSLPGKVNHVLKLNSELYNIAEHFIHRHHVLYLGRGSMLPIAMEGALKLKEISYIHAEAYAAGELKHGPLALVDKDMSVIAVAPNDKLLQKLKSNLHEVRARGGELYVFADLETQLESTEGTTVINMSPIDYYIAPIVYAVPLQLFAYHVAVLKGTDVDQPRNLAKSVTVE